MNDSSGDEIAEDLNTATEWWWIDYLEDEMDQGLEKDLELLLHHSQEDRESFERFRILREWLRSADPVAHWPLEEGRLARMRQNVMAAISELPTPDAGGNYLETAKVDTKSLRV